MTISSMTIGRFHHAVFGSNISTPRLTYKRLNRIGIKLDEHVALTPALAKRARAAYERYKRENPGYAQRLRSAASARAVRKARRNERPAAEEEAIPIPEGARELALPLHVIPGRARLATVKNDERKPQRIDVAVQDRQIAIMLLQAAVALLNR